MSSTLNFVFSKADRAKWLSHLELMQVFRRAFRRAGLPLGYSQGFHPHMKLSLERALKVGQESSNENGRVELAGPVDIADAMQKINSTLPKGVEIVSISPT